MVNRHRGEMSIQMNGTPQKLCLTLGALADLEDRYGGKNILALVDTFAAKGLSANDVTNVLRAGLQGGGAELQDEALMAAQFDGGFAGAARAAAMLLKISFGLDDTQAPAADPAPREVVDEPAPFPGAV